MHVDAAAKNKIRAEPRRAERAERERADGPNWQGENEQPVLQREK